MNLANSREDEIPAEHFRRLSEILLTFGRRLIYFSLCIYMHINISFIYAYFLYISLFVYKFALHVSLVAFTRTIPTRIRRFRSFIRRTDFHVVPRAL